MGGDAKLINIFHEKWIESDEEDLLKIIKV